MALLAEPRIELVPMSEFLPADFDVEESGATFEENAWLKALGVCEASGHPALSDDSGLEVDALGGRPGVYSARYAGPSATDSENNQLLLEELAAVPASQRTARFRCVLCFAAPSASGPERLFSASGAVEGRIIQQARGSLGFGYDPLFEAHEFPGQTTAEITAAQKNGISHRGRAAGALRAALVGWLDDAESRRP